ncbi:uncharacterized protein LOC130080159 [Rhinichthys klamathensis goyatoka]|uniref:uncharacterized protein LOC130080159 n=1 Tax=Rhinichthys klamathensis goyatoka TaxID=3034132 RepID=UPI0024B58E5A|nr:uncharacterized protein LOC130080159 [Rhinichthys klamathensis goyatoka]
MFKVNFDLLGGMTMDKWFEEQFVETSTNMNRHAEVLKCNIDTFEKTRNEKNTVQQTQWAVKCFGDWCSEKGCSIDFKQITKTELNALLRDFYGTVRSSKGEKYGISSYVALRAGVNRFLNDSPLSLSWCLMRDSEFTSSNNVFVGVVKTMRREGRDKTEHHTSISTKDFSTIKLSDALNPNTPEGLVNKVWFDVQLHFGRRGKEGNRELIPDSFRILTNENGVKYVTMSFNEDTKNHKDPHDRNKESRRGFMFQQTGNPLCPVASLEKYVSLLPSNPPAFYLHPKKQNLSKCVWYTREPMGVNYLATMLQRICKAAGTSKVYTNHCLRSTMVQRLSDAGLESREIMSVSGHKCESSLQSYWRPNLKQRKHWSDILAATENTADSAEPQLKRTALNITTVEPIEMRQIFNACTINGDVQINLNKQQ